MLDKQIPTGSGFRAHTTAEEVLAGQDLTGKIAIVTGGHSGIGLETTRVLADAGALVIVGARQISAAQEALAHVGRVEIDELDLANLSSVRGFAERFVASGRHADIVINNAGIFACPEMRVGPGWESQFAVNHLGHYALVNWLWPAIAGNGGARVIAVSSVAHHLSPIRWDDMQFADGYDKWKAYGQSKTANALFAVHLDALGQNTGVRAFSLHPGRIFTPVIRYLTREELADGGWIDANGNAATDGSLKTVPEGAATQVWAATSSQLEGSGGLYCEDCEVAPHAVGEEFAGVRDYAINPEQAARLWELSAELCGVDNAS